MEQHPLLDILQELTEDIRLEGNNTQLPTSLAHIDYHLNSLLKEHHSLQEELTSKTAELKHISKKLRKTNSKLIKKT